MTLKVLKGLALTIVVGGLVALVTLIVKAYSNDPYTNAVYTWGRDVRDYRSDLRRKPAEVLRFAQVKPGEQVVDLLGGAGYYTELLSYVVGAEGHVYVQNNSLFLRFSRSGLEKRLAGGRLSNVTRLDSEFADMQLPRDVDLIFMGLSYHDIYVPRDDPTIMTSREEFFPQIWASLRSGGRILVIDHAAQVGSGASSAPKLHRIEEDYAIKDFQEEGYIFKGSLNILRNPKDNYGLDIWDDEVEDRTDKFILLFEKP